MCTYLLTTAEIADGDGVGVALQAVLAQDVAAALNADQTRPDQTRPGKGIHKPHRKIRICSV